MSQAKQGGKQNQACYPTKEQNSSTQPLPEQQKQQSANSKHLKNKIGSRPQTQTAIKKQKSSTKTIPQIPDPFIK
jgi:hypothetical protein